MVISTNLDDLKRFPRYYTLLSKTIARRVDKRKYVVYFFLRFRLAPPTDVYRFFFTFSTVKKNSKIKKTTVFVFFFSTLTTIYQHNQRRVPQHGDSEFEVYVDLVKKKNDIAKPDVTFFLYCE